MKSGDEAVARRELTERLWALGEADSTEAALFHQAAAATYGVGITDMKALGILLREGPQPAGALIGRLSVTSGAVTGIVDRLERSRLARRRPDVHDRRKVIVEVDPQGLADRENVYLGIGDAFDRLYATYSTDELRFLVRHMEASVELTRRQTLALRPDAHR